MHFHKAAIAACLVSGNLAGRVHADAAISINMNANVATISCTDPNKSLSIQIGTAQSSENSSVIKVICMKHVKPKKPKKPAKPPALKPLAPAQS